MDNKIEILKVVVGSQAHGLADENSDFDYRAVYVLPTSDILSMGYKYKGSDWIEGEVDNTAYELGHFLQLATKCNPTILEVFKAPIVSITDEGRQLLDLFTYIWNPQDAFNAFVGYGLNQRKKFLDRKDNREAKYAVAYIRTLINLIDLLYSGDFSLRIKDEKLLKKLKSYRKGQYTFGSIIDEAEELIAIAKTHLNNCKQVADLNKVNEFLIQTRKNHW